jgi:RNA polymerase sigma-70 factor (ECF subfamily)
MTQDSPEARLHNFETAVFPHTPALLRYAARLCRSASDADDIVQESLMRAWKYWDGFQPGTNCRAWLFRIVANVIQRKRERIESAAEHVSLESPTVGNLLRFEPRFEINESGLAEAMARLPFEYREVIVLALVEEFSYKEIASILSVPMGTVMSRLHRARERMRHLLKPPAAAAQ